jgi:quinol monooxygenase YgiN
MESQIALCTYRVKEHQDQEFLRLLSNHYPTLRRLGLVTDEPSLLFRGTDESGKSFFVEILHWKSRDGHKVAEQMPEVLAIWEKMGQLVEGRMGRPAMEFPFVEPIT